MPKHTSGPWRLARTRGMVSVSIESASGQRVATVWRRFSSGITPDTIAEGMANARLIAAAPELLEALIALRDAVSVDPVMQDRKYINLGIQVNNAIQKAGG